MSYIITTAVVTIISTDCTYISSTTGCLITERSKVEAFYVHLGWNLWVFQTLHSKTILVHLIPNTYNGNYVIISIDFSWKSYVVWARSEDSSKQLDI